MGTMTTAAKGTPTGSRKLVDMNWDPITGLSAAWEFLRRLISTTVRSPNVTALRPSFADTAFS